MSAGRLRTLASLTLLATLVSVAAASAQVQVTLTSITPSSGQPAMTKVTLTGNGFPTGPIPASNVLVTLTPEVAGTGPSATTAAQAVTVGKKGSGSITFIVPAALIVAAPTRYAVSAAGATAAVVGFTTNALTFTVNPPQQLLSVTPASGDVGTSLTVTLQTSKSTFKGGAAQASFGADISVGGAAPGSFGPLTVVSSTSATASLAIASNASGGARDVTIRVGTQQTTQLGAFTVIVTTPRPTITASATPPPNGAGWNTTDVSIAFTCTNATSCGPDRVVTTEGAGQVITGTASGPGGTATTSVTLNIDKTPPALSITSPSDGTTTISSDVVLGGAVGDAVSGLAGVRCGAGAATVSGGTYSCTVALGVGDNAITVHADDVAGNSVDQAIHVTREAQAPPKVTITAPAPGALFSRSPITVTGTVDDPAAFVLVDGIPASVVNGTFTASAVNLREGLNIVTATATSGSGAVGSASSSVLLDTTPPRLLIQAPADGSVVSVTQVPVAGMVNDIVSGTVNVEQVTVTVNGIEAAVSNRSFFVPEVLLVRGQNTIRAVARDRAGNEQAAEIHVTLRDSAGSQVIARVSGDGQTATVGDLLPQPLVAQLVDSDGRPVAGRPVTFSVTRSDGVLSTFGAEGQQLSVVSDGAGLAILQFRVGSRVGAGINEVVATAPGFGGQAIFCATSTPGVPTAIKGAGVMGEAHRGIAGQALPLPLEAVVFDASGNPVPDVPVTFSVIRGGGTIDGLIEVVRPTNSDGRVAVTLVLGTDVTPNANVVRASISGPSGPPVTFTATGYLPGSAAATRVSGIVLDNSDQPVPGATAKIVGTPLTAVSDAVGRFTIENAPVGTLTLIVDGSTSPRQERFPFLAFMVLAIAGQDNTIGMPIYLPPLDASNSKVVGGDDTAVLTMKDVPGVAFTVFPHSATFPDGSRIGRLSLSQVHADKVPMPPPNGSTPRVVWTLQPAGVKFDPPIKVQLPNTDGYQPGQVVEVFQFDHDLEQFVSIGPARVSADGSVLVTDPGFGTTKAGWGAAQPPPPPPTTNVSSCSPNDPASNSNDPASGPQNGPRFAAPLSLPDMCMVGQAVDDQCVQVPVAVSSVDIGAAGGTGGGGGSGRTLARLNAQIVFSVNVTATCAQQTVSWNFGDGSSGGGASVSHNYTQPGRYTATATVSCTGCAGTVTASDSFEVIVAPDMTVTKIKSEQFPGASAANFLPGGTGGGRNPPPYLLMGASGDGMLHVSADVTVTPGAGGLTLLAALRETNEASAPATAIVGSTVTLGHALSSPVVVDYEVAAGVDADEDGRLTANEIIGRLGTVKGVSAVAYNAARTALGVEFLGGAVLTTEAAQFLGHFLGGGLFSDSEKTITTETIPFNRELLDHNLGLRWNASGTGVADIQRVTFTPTSSLAISLRDSAAFKTAITNFLGGEFDSLIKREFVQFFIDNPTIDVHDFEKQVSCPTPPAGCRPFGVNFGPTSGLNAFFGFAGAFYDGKFIFRARRTTVPFTPTTTVVLESVTFSPDSFGRSQVFDLYDFDYDLDVAGPNALGAIVEAGFPTLGDSGRIFWTAADIAGTRTDIPFDFCVSNPTCASLPPQ